MGGRGPARRPTSGGDSETDSRPRSREQMTAAAMWLDRKPQDFVRAMRKAMSEPQLLGLPSAGGTAAVLGGNKPKSKPFKRPPIEPPSETIARQERADQKKAEIELANAEKRADMTRREHSSLVAERMRKAAKVEQLTVTRDSIDEEQAQREQEAKALSARLEALEREAVQLEVEVCARTVFQRPFLHPPW